MNFVYGAVGLFLMSQLTNPGSWKSFVLGWAVSVVNLELFKRLGLMLLMLFEGGKLNPVFYGLLIVKFSFWGLIIALFCSLHWIQAVPFVLGNLTLVVAAFVLGIREMTYARG